MRFVRHEILHKDAAEDVDQGGWLRLAYSLSGVPLSAALDMIRRPLWALNIVGRRVGRHHRRNEQSVLDLPVFIDFYERCTVHGG